METKKTPLISVIVPLFNEAENVPLLHKGLTEVMRSLKVPYEVLLVDDGSEDATFCISSEIATLDASITVIKLRRNFGQSAAFAAGIDHANGEIIITIDGDLQNDPADIPRLLYKLDEGFDVVVGWRHRRLDALLTRRIPSVLANRLIGMVTGISIHDNGCSLKAFRGEVARTLPLYSDMHRFIPAAAAISGARITEIKVRHHPRKHGSSKYGLSRVYKVILDLLRVKTILSFATRPFFWFSVSALPFGVLGAALLIYHGVGMVREQVPLVSSPGVVGLLFLMLATMLVLTGMLAELISRSAYSRVSRTAIINSSRLTRSRDEPGQNGS
jgi:glycosyltransferase involved in cell wall biosynthesis